MPGLLVGTGWYGRRLAVEASNAMDSDARHVARVVRASRLDLSNAATKALARNGTTICGCHSPTSAPSPGHGLVASTAWTGSFDRHDEQQDKHRWKGWA
jgi:hypothetical protein